MNDFKHDYIQYRLKCSDTAFEDAQLLAENERWNACINRLYYACYYAVSALLLMEDINAQTHAGCKMQFGLHFVKTGRITFEQGKLYSDLMDSRQKGDYGDMFDFDGDIVLPLFDPVKNLLNAVRILTKTGN
jgi:uncharacterized protein (UPF0332 family)